MAITTILDVRKTKLNDFVLWVHAGTNSPALVVTNLDGDIITTITSPSWTSGGFSFFELEISAELFAEQTYYLITITDLDLIVTTFLMYVSFDNSIQEILYDIGGLVGINSRFHTFTYTNGNLTSFYCRIYATTTDLQNALDEITDNFRKEFLITLEYDTQYNITNITSSEED